MAFSVLSLMLGTAVRDGVVTRNACADVARPKVDTAEADYLSPALMRQVIAAMSGHRLEPLLLLLASTGLRIGEALALRWSDLDLDAGQLRVTGTLQHTGGQVRRASPKSQRSRRTLPINAAVVEPLKGWRKVQAAERLRAGTSWASSESGVFTTSSGQALDRRSAVRSFERALKLAKVDAPARFHVLRHSVASMMLADGKVSMRTASEILGHSSTAPTADTYAHVMPEAKAHALGVVGDALSG